MGYSVDTVGIQLALYEEPEIPSPRIRQRQCSTVYRKSGYCLHFLCLSHIYSQIQDFLLLKVQNIRKKPRGKHNISVRQPWSLIYISIQTVLFIFLAIL